MAGVESAGGALHFDADVDNKKYLASVIAMENRYEQFAQKVIRNNRAMNASFTSATAGLNTNFRGNINDAEQALKNFYNTAETGNRRIRNDFDNLGGSLNRSGNAIKSNSNNMLALVGSYLSAGAALKYILDQTLAFERIKSPLTFILGSEGAADAKLQELKKFASDLGIEFFTLANSYKSFAAAARASNFDLAQSEKIFRSVTKASAVLKLSTPQLEGALLAIQQMISKGNVQAEELRGQLAERLPGAFSLAAKAMGVTEKELNKLLETGQVVASDLLPKLADQLDQSYGDKAADGIKGLNAELNNFWSTLQSFAGEGSFLSEKIFQPIIRGASDLLKSLRDLTDIQERRGVGEWFVSNFSLDPTVSKTYKEVFDLRKRFTQSQSILDASAKNDYSTKTVEELRNFYQANNVAFKDAVKNYNQFAAGVKSGNLKEEFDGQLKGVQSISVGLRFEQKRIGAALDQAKRTQIAGNKEIADSALTSVSEIRKRITELQKLPNSATVGSEIYKRIEALQARLKEPKKAIDSYINAQQRLQTEIDELVKSSTRKTKDADAAEIQAVEDKYAKIQKKIDQFYANQKNKGGSVDSTKLNGAKQSELDAIRFDQDTKKMLVAIGLQEDLYDKYEQYKTDVSKEAADIRLKNELANYDNFGDYLQSYIAPLLDKVMGGEFLNDKENERLEKLTELYNKFGVKQKEVQNKLYADAVLAAETAEDQINKVKIKYANYAKQIQATITDEQKAKLKADRDAEIQGIIDQEFKKTDIYKQLNTEIIQQTRERAKIEIQVIEDLMKKAQNLSPEMTKNLESALKSAKSVLSIGSGATYVKELKARKAGIEDIISKQTLSNDQLEEYKRILEEINAELKNQGALASKVSKVGAAMAEIGAAVGELGAALEDTNPEIAYTLGTLSDLAKVGSDAAGAFTAFASGDIVGGIAKTLSAVAGLFSIGSKVKKMNAEARAEIAKFYEDARVGEIAYQALLRERERKLLEINAIGLKGIEDQSKGLKAQQAQIQKDYEETLKRLQGEQQITGYDYRHGTWLRKVKNDPILAGLGGMNYDQLEQLYTQNKLTDSAKALFEELRKLKEEGADVSKALEDAAVAASELATGTNVKSLSATIIADLKAGKTGLQNVMDDYSEIIRDGLLSVFESDVVQVEMKAFYKRLSDLALSDGKLTQEEIDQAKLDYIATRKRIEDQYKALEQFTGVSLKDPKAENTDTGITASVRSLSQDTGVVIEGLMRGIYDNVKINGSYSAQNAITLGQQNAFLSQQVALQTEIRDNTSRLAVNSDGQLIKLDAMIQELKILTGSGNANPGRNGGLIP